jgi:hypothetical protein
MRDKKPLKEARVAVACKTSTRLQLVLAPQRRLEMDREGNSILFVGFSNRD